MKRRIVQHGESSLTISLPFRWVKNMHLSKGDELEVEEMGKTLQIHAGKEERKREISLKISKHKPFFKRYLINLYKQGYDEIKIDFDGPVPNEEVIEKIDELLGYEIVEQGEKHIIIRNVAQVVEEEFDAMLRRLFILILSMAEDSIQALQEKDYTYFEKLVILEKESNKIANFCQRILNRKGSTPLDTTTHLYTFVDRLELIADSLGDMGTTFQKHTKISPETLAFFKSLTLFMRSICEQFYTFKEERIAELKKKRFSLYHLFQSLNPSKHEIVIICNLKQILEELHHIEFSLIQSR